MNRTIIVGSRESKLAARQSMLLVEYLRSALPGTEVTLLTMKTTGDKILDKTLDKIGGKGLFVKELDMALREHRADLTVHSLKDMPMEIPEDLPLLCFSRREDPRDVLVLPERKTEPEPGMVIGTSSPRRFLQIRELYPDSEVRPVRGNLQTRLRKLDEGRFDALVLAAAGLKRMGLEHRISQYFSTDEMIPATGQGILAVQGRRGEAYPFLAGFGDRDAALAAVCERAFVRELDGGCTSPACAFAAVSGGRIHLTGLYYDEATATCRRGSLDGDTREAEQLGIHLARRLRSERGRV